MVSPSWKADLCPFDSRFQTWEPGSRVTGEPRPKSTNNYLAIIIIIIIITITTTTNTIIIITATMTIAIIIHIIIMTTLMRDAKCRHATAFNKSATKTFTNNS